MREYNDIESNNMTIDLAMTEGQFNSSILKELWSTATPS